MIFQSIYSSMKTNFTVLLFIINVVVLHAQVQVTPQAIISCGKSFQKSNVGVTFTVGEIILKPSSSNQNISNGLIASAISFTVTDIQTFQSEYKFQLFPNPTTHYATLQMSTTNDIPVFIKIVDMNGKQILVQNLFHSTAQYSFDLKDWSSGMYTLQIFNQTGNILQNIKFEKIQ